jgi:hypothetical protein
LDQNNKIPPLQKCLAEIVITLLGTIIKEKFRYYNAIIDAVAAYYYFQERGAAAVLYKRSSTRGTIPIPSKEISP